MTQAKISLSETGSGPATIELDGVDVASRVTGLRLMAGPRDFTTLRLDLNLNHTVVEADVKVIIDPMTAMILKAAGWIGPTGA